MKRHPALISFSREHHQMLLLARLMRDDSPAYKGMPTTTDGKIAYAQNLFQNLLKDHFDKEEKLFAKLLSIVDKNTNKVVEELLEEHVQLEGMFQDLDTKTLDITGRALEKHIRKEERILFQAIQSELGDQLNSLVDS